jgi:2-oxoglutarate ferredoxin oxidoreductase subunit beta
MEGPDFPIALGVIRDVEAPTYNDSIYEQIADVKSKKSTKSLEDLLMQGDVWEVK